MIDPAEVFVYSRNGSSVDSPSAVSDQALRHIAEQGFFGAPGCLAKARLACSELLFARAVIEAQTAKIAELTSGARNA